MNLRTLLTGIFVAFGYLLLTIQPSIASNTIQEDYTNCSSNLSFGKVATSADGRYVLFTSFNTVYVSSNYCESSSQVPTLSLAPSGLTYLGIPTIAENSVAGVKSTYSVAISDSGQIQSVGTNKGVYTSMDFGVTWKNILGSMGEDGWQTAISGDGQFIYAASVNRIIKINRSENTAPIRSINQPLLGIKTNADGSIFWVRTASGIYRWSMVGDAGTFQPIYSDPVDYWSMSQNGQYIAVVPSRDVTNVFVSSDFGTTWELAPRSRLIPETDNERKKCVVISDDGTLLLVYTDSASFYHSRTSTSLNFSEAGAWGPWDIRLGYSDAVISKSGNTGYMRDNTYTLRRVFFTPLAIIGFDLEVRDSGAYLFWSPELEPTFPNLDYLVEYSTDATTWTRFNDGVSSTPNVTVTGLTNGNRYFFRVAPVNRYGQTLPWLVDYTGLRPFGSAIGPVVNLVSIFGQNVNLNATFNHNGLTFNRAYFNLFDSETNILAAGFSTDLMQSTYSLSSSTLISGRSYYLKSYVRYLAPLNLDPEQIMTTSRYSEMSTSSNVVRALSTPSVPRFVSIELGDTAATVAWVAPLTNGFTNILGYDIFVKYDGGRNFLESDLRTIVGGAATFSAPITGLTNNLVFDLGIRARNVAGVSAVVNVGAFATQATPTVPDAPTSVVAIPGDTSIKVNWTKPTSDGGRPITGYEITYYTSIDSPTTVNIAANQISHTITGVNNYQQYMVSVTAINIVGSSSATLISGAVTPSGAPTSISVTRNSVGHAAGSAFATQPQVSIKDNAGSIMSGDNSTVVTASISAGATLIGTGTATVTSGMATFTNLGLVGTAGTNYLITYTARIGFSDSTLTFSSEENVTATTGNAYQLFLVTPAGGTQPGLFTTQPEVRVLDRGGNLVTDGSSLQINVSAFNSFYNDIPYLNIAPGPGLFSMTTSGIATFSGLSFLYPGEFVLTFSATDLVSTSQSIIPTPGVAKKVAVGTNSINERIRVGNVQLGAVFTTQPIFKIVDLVGTLVDVDTGTVTLSVSAGTLVGNNVATISNGVAQFSGLSISNLEIANGSSTMVQITATSGSLDSIIDSFVVSNGSYTLNFARNGATSGAPPSNIIVASNASDTTLPGKNTLERVGFEFIGWGTTSTSITPLSTYSPTGNTTLFAIWGGLTSRTLTMDPIGDKIYGAPDVTIMYSLSAGSSTGVVTFLSTSSSCNVTDRVVKIVAVGRCEIVGSATGLNQYRPASASISFNVAPKPLVVVASIAAKIHDGTRNPGIVTISSVSTVESSDTATVVAIVPLADAPDVATYALPVSFTVYSEPDIENFNYSAASSVLSFVISQASQSITFTTPNAMTVGDGDQSLIGSATSGLAPTYSTSNTAICTVVSGKLQAVGPGICEVTASQSGDTNYFTGSPIIKTLTISAAVVVAPPTPAPVVVPPVVPAPVVTPPVVPAPVVTPPVVPAPVVTPPVVPAPVVTPPVVEEKLLVIKKLSNVTLTASNGGKTFSANSKRRISAAVQSVRTFLPKTPVITIQITSYFNQGRSNTVTKAQAERLSQLIRNSYKGIKLIKFSTKLVKKTTIKAAMAVVDVRLKYEQ